MNDLEKRMFEKIEEFNQWAKSVTDNLQDLHERLKVLEEVENE